MQIKPLFIVILLFAFSNPYAQEITIGIKGGINYNNIGELYHYGPESGGGVNANPAVDTYYTADKEMGTQFGAFIMIAFGKVFIRPEINFTSLKNNYSLELKMSNWTATRLDFPILLGYKIYKPVSIYAGPVFSKISTMELEGVEYPIVFKESALNLQAGILFDFGRFGFDFRYEYGLKPIEAQEIDMFATKYGTNRGRLLEYNPSQIQLSIHINLFKINAEGGNNLRTGWRGKGCPN